MGLGDVNEQKHILGTGLGTSPDTANSDNRTPPPIEALGENDGLVLSNELIAGWADQLRRRAEDGEWDPDRWPHDMKLINRKIYAATFLLSKLTRDNKTESR